jgi:hypothetical protein
MAAWLVHAMLSGGMSTIRLSPTMSVGVGFTIIAILWIFVAFVVWLVRLNARRSWRR